MATMKTFEVAGVSTLNGKTKVRFANDYVGRFKILVKNGHDDINLIELGEKLTKEEICKVLLAHPNFQDEAAQTAIAEFVVRNVKTTKVEAAEDAEAELA
jgi:dUTPase